MCAIKAIFAVPPPSLPHVCLAPGDSRTIAGSGQLAYPVGRLSRVSPCSKLGDKFEQPIMLFEITIWMQLCLHVP